MDRVLRKPEVEDMTGYSDRTLRRLEANGQFPKRFPLNPNPKAGWSAVGWSEVEVKDWVRARQEARNVDACISA